MLASKNGWVKSVIIGISGCIAISLSPAIVNAHSAETQSFGDDESSVPKTLGGGIDVYFDYPHPLNPFSSWSEGTLQTSYNGPPKDVVVLDVTAPPLDNCDNEEWAGGVEVSESATQSVTNGGGWDASGSVSAGIPSGATISFGGGYSDTWEWTESATGTVTMTTGDVPPDRILYFWIYHWESEREITEYTYVIGPVREWDSSSNSWNGPWCSHSHLDYDDVSTYDISYPTYTMFTKKEATKACHSCTYQPTPTWEDWKPDDITLPSTSIPAPSYSAGERWYGL